MRPPFCFAAACCLHIILFLGFASPLLTPRPQLPSIITFHAPSSLVFLLCLYKRPRSVSSSAAARRQFSRINYFLGSARRRSSVGIEQQRDLRALDSMGLEVAEISELAALRPIQTTAVTAAGADDHDAAAVADTGCVTPTARATAGAAANDDTAVDGIGCATPTASRSVAAPQRDGGVDDTVYYATPTACRTASPLDVREFDAVALASAGDAAAALFTTPTSDESALRPAMVCPPAPRKLAPALKRKLAPLQQRLFYPVPLDLATVFKPAPPAPPAAKKMREHVVESSLPLGT